MDTNLVELDTHCDHTGQSTNDDGTVTCLYCGRTGTITATPNRRGGTTYEVTWNATGD